MWLCAFIPLTLFKSSFIKIKQTWRVTHMHLLKWSDMRKFCKLNAQCTWLYIFHIDIIRHFKATKGSRGLKYIDYAKARKSCVNCWHDNEHFGGLRCIRESCLRLAYATARQFINGNWIYTQYIYESKFAIIFLLNLRFFFNIVDVLASWSGWVQIYRFYLNLQFSPSIFGNKNKKTKEKTDGRTLLNIWII